MGVTKYASFWRQNLYSTYHYTFKSSFPWLTWQVSNHFSLFCAWFTDQSQCTDSVFYLKFLTYFFSDSLKLLVCCLVSFPLPLPHLPHFDLSGLILQFMGESLSIFSDNHPFYTWPGWWFFSAAPNYSCYSQQMILSPRKNWLHLTKITPNFVWKFVLCCSNDKAILNCYWRQALCLNNSFPLASYFCAL